MNKIKASLLLALNLICIPHFAYADTGSFQISLDNLVHYDSACTPGQGDEYHFMPSSIGAFMTSQKENCNPVYPYAGYPTGHIVFIPKATGFSVACDDTSDINSCKGVQADYVINPNAKCTFTNAATGQLITQSLAFPINAPPPPVAPFPTMTVNYNCQLPPPPPTTYHVNVSVAGTKLTNLDLSKVNSKCDAQGCQSTQLQLNSAVVSTPWAFNGNSLAIQNIMPNQANNWQLQLHYVLPSIDGSIANVDVTCDTGQQTLTDGGSYTLNCQEHVVPPPQPTTYHVNLQLTGTDRIDLSKVDSACSATGCAGAELQLNGSDVTTPWAVNGSSLDIPNVLPNQSNNWQMQLHYVFPDQADPTTSTFVDCDTGQQSLVDGNTYTLSCQEHTGPTPPPKTYHITVNLTGNGAYMLNQSLIASACDKNSIMTCTSTSLTVNSTAITNWGFNGNVLEIDNVIPYQQNQFQLTAHYWSKDPQEPMQDTYVDCDSGQQTLVDGGTYNLDCEMTG